MAQPHLWNLDDPFLYRVTAGAGHRRNRSASAGRFAAASATSGSPTATSHLNGKRIFLKSTHTGNHMPIGQQAPALPDFVRRDLINAKAAGFNTVRFIAGMACPEQLDFCDELGLMV